MAEAWRDLSWAMEAELCGVTDRYRGEGLDGQWCGRRDGVRYVKAPPLPARAMGELGSLDMEGYRVRGALNRIEELASLARIAESRVKELSGEMSQEAARHRFRGQELIRCRIQWGQKRSSVRPSRALCCSGSWRPSRRG